MSALENVISPILASVSPPYQHPDFTKRDILAMHHLYKGLIPNPGKIIFNDGREKDFLHIQGTIPTTFKGKVYNTPISLSLPDTFPNHPPLAFVKPTPSMEINPQTKHQWYDMSALLTQMGF